MIGTIQIVDKSVNDNSANILSLWRHSFTKRGSVCPLMRLTAKLNSKSFTAAHLGSNTNQHTDWKVGGTCIKISRSVDAPRIVQSVRLYLFKYRGGDNAYWISKNKINATAGQWGLCGTNFRENMASLWVSCYSGNNDRSARVLFVLRPREQGECWRQVSTASFALPPRVLDEQYPRNPVIIP